MTAQPVAPVIPSSACLGASWRNSSCVVRRLPSPASARPAAPEDVVYGIGRIDASGRVADRAITHTPPRWRSGDRLTLTADARGGGHPP
jgi:hypothetical protein